MTDVVEERGEVSDEDPAPRARHEDRPDAVRKTYLGLRLAMILLVVLLFAAVAVQVWWSGPGTCYRDSFSAYYFTPARPVFVAALFGLGLCLVSYRGNTDHENVLLNVSGFLAMIVAFVPADIGVDRCDVSNLPTEQEIYDASTSSVVALFVVGFAALGLGGYFFVRSRRWERRSRISMGSAVVTTVGLLAGLLFFTSSREAFQSGAHRAAAISLFVGIFLVVALNALGSTTNLYRGIYGTLALAMPAGAGIAALAGGQHRVFWVEAVLILLFAVYWAVQTFELRTEVFRPHQPSGWVLGRAHDAVS